MFSLWTNYIILFLLNHLVNKFKNVVGAIRSQLSTVHHVVGTDFNAYCRFMLYCEETNTRQQGKVKRVHLFDKLSRPLHWLLHTTLLFIFFNEENL